MGSEKVKRYKFADIAAASSRDLDTQTEFVKASDHAAEVGRLTTEWHDRMRIALETDNKLRFEMLGLRAERDALAADNARLREGLDRIERLNLDHGGCYSAAIQRELEALAVPPSASQEKP